MPINCETKMRTWRCEKVSKQRRMWIKSTIFRKLLLNPILNQTILKINILVELLF